MILVALVLVGGGMPARGGLVRQPLGRAPRPRSLLGPAVVGTAVGVVALLLTQGTWRAAVIGTFIAAIIGLSLVVVTGYAGQVSLAQLALAGTAAFTPELPHRGLGRAVPDRAAAGRAGGHGRRRRRRPAGAAHRAGSRSAS